LQDRPDHIKRRWHTFFNYSRYALFSKWHILCKIFRNGSTTTCCADGTFFIDRNPRTFKYILDFIRIGDIVVESADRNLRSQLREDAEFFEFSDELEEYLRFSSLAGIDLSLSEVSWLNKELGSRKLGGLLFDTSKDAMR